MPETNYNPDPVTAVPYSEAPSTPVGSNKSDTIILSTSYPNGRKLHSVVYTNNSGADHYIHLIASGETITGNPIIGSLPAFFCMLIQDGEQKSIDWGSSGRATPDGFTVVASNSKTDYGASAWVDIDNTQGTYCDVTYSE